jgi:hypothetical protein
MNIDITHNISHVTTRHFYKLTRAEIYGNGTVKITRFIGQTTQRSFLFNDLNSMTHALQFVV